MDTSGFWLMFASITSQMLARSVLQRKEDRSKVALTNWYEADPEVDDEKEHMEDEPDLRNSIILYTRSKGYDWKRKIHFWEGLRRTYCVCNMKLPFLYPLSRMRVFIGDCLGWSS